MSAFVGYLLFHRELVMRIHGCPVQSQRHFVRPLDDTGGIGDVGRNSA